MSPKTVLYVANAAKIGGGNKVLMDLILNVQRTSYRGVLVSPAAGPLTDWARQHDVPCEISAGGDWFSLGGLTRRTLEFIYLARRTRAAVVHASSPEAYRALGLAAKITGAASVCHLGFPPLPGELERSFLAGPDAVIGCYQGQAAENRDRILRIRPACRVVGIPNGVDTARFTPGPVPDRLVKMRAGYATVVAILGHISKVKGYPTFVEAAGALARKHTGCLFLAIGDERSEPGARESVEARGRELGLGDRLRFLGFRDDVNEILRLVDIVAMPSEAEGLPLALLEAMACGKAVVTTPVNGIPEAVTDGETGLFVPPGDAEALTAALSSLIAFPERRAHLGAAARKRMESAFSITTFARQVEQVYDELTVTKGYLRKAVKGSQAAAV